MRGSSLKGVVVGAIVGAVVAAATTAIAAPHVFNLEASNSAAAKTSVTGSFNDRMLQLTNNSGGANATALGLTVPAGRPPLAVSSSVLVPNLNADSVDGYGAQAAPAANKLLPLGSNAQFARSTIPEKVTAVFQNRRGPLPMSGTFTTSGGNLLVTVSGSGYRAQNGGTIGLHVLIDGTVLGVARTYTNEVGSHKSFVLTSVPLTGVGSGQHTLTLDFLNLTATNEGDYFSATVEEIPGAIGFGQDFLEPNETAGQQVDACNVVLPDQSFYASLSFRLGSGLVPSSGRLHDLARDDSPGAHRRRGHGRLRQQQRWRSGRRERDLCSIARTRRFNPTTSPSTSIGKCPPVQVHLELQLRDGCTAAGRKRPSERWRPH